LPQFQLDLSKFVAERKLQIPPKCVLVLFGSLAGQGTALRRSRNAFNRSVERHIAADGQVFVQCYDKADPLQSFANWANFKPVCGGFCQFQCS
jgi:hypothetical protein